MRDLIHRRSGAPNRGAHRWRLAARAMLLTCIFSLCAWPAMAMEVGDRVRIHLNDRTHPSIGTLVARSADSCTIARSGGALDTSVAMSSIRAWERSEGTHRQWGRGALIGGVVGATIGAVGGYAGTSDDEFIVSPGEAAFSGAVAFGIAGAVLGGLIGLRFETDRWVHMPLEQAPAMLDDREGVLLVPRPARRVRVTLATVRF